MHIRDFFYFQRSDRRVLLMIIVITAAVSAFIKWGGVQSEKTAELKTDTAQASAQKPKELSQRQWSHRPTRRWGSNQYAVGDVEMAAEPELFAFDPNEADSTALLRLGLMPWQVRNIYRYRARGGVFRKKSDFARVYGLTVKQYRRLEPFIRISPDYGPASSLAAANNKATPTDSIPRPDKLMPGESVDINRADTSQLRRVPGIGSYRAMMIVRLRERLGGFVDASQVELIDGIPPESMEYFEVSKVEIRKLDINRLTLRQLMNHPYINYAQARAIIDFRHLNGNIQDLGQLSRHPQFTQADINRLRPYIKY